VVVSIHSDGATAIDSTLLVAIDSAQEEAVRSDVGPRPGEAADSDGVPVLDPNLAAVFVSDHVE
jgi:hypothetical protein